MDTTTVPPPPTALSDPAAAWEGSVAAPRPPASVASSTPSVNSVTRRARARAAFEAEARARRQMYEEEERQLWAAMEEEMQEEDVKSEMGRQEDLPRESAQEAEEDVIRRILAPVEHEREILRRMLDHKVSSAPAPLATFGVKVKAKEPKPWTGLFTYAEREGWIKMAKLYLAGLELDMDALLDEEKTPFPFYTIRSLFSTDAANDQVSPQTWFDSRNRRQPFVSVNDVFKAVRSHWADDDTGEKALARYRGARQGNLRARDFGALLDSLADACESHDRTLDDLDRRTTYIDGLNSAVKDFVKTQLATRRALGKATETFDEVVQIAALTDSLSSFSAKKTTSLSSPSSASKKTSTQESQTKPSSSAPTPPRTGTTWTQDAVAWQAQNPVAKKAEWFDARARLPMKPVRCYNCGDVSQHFSRACTAARKDPRNVVIAMLSKLSISSPRSSPSPSPASAISSVNRFEALSEDEGKEDEE
ncbi:hypothetical protein JCM1840_005114 [Sporobolomyces johnsonii]